MPWIVTRCSIGPDEEGTESNALIFRTCPSLAVAVLVPMKKELKVYIHPILLLNLFCCSIGPDEEGTERKKP